MSIRKYVSGYEKLKKRKKKEEKLIKSQKRSVDKFVISCNDTIWLPSPKDE